MENDVNAALKVLIALACIAVISASWIFISDRRDERQAEADRSARAAAAIRMTLEAQARAERDAVEAAEHRSISDCRRDLDAYDKNGTTLPFVVRVQHAGETLTGGAMAAKIQECRDLIAD